MAVRSLLRASAGAWVLAIALPDRAGARGLPARLHGDGGIDARTYRALRPGRPRGSGRRDRRRRARGARAPPLRHRGPGSRSAPSSCSSSPPASTRARPRYPRHEHIVTAGKYVEYALLAPAAALIVRRTEDFALLVFTLVASSVAATALGVVQFLGWGIVHAWTAGYRQPSFLGHHDFAALSGVTLAVGLAAIALPGRARVDRWLAWAAGVAGALGLLVSGSTAGAIGLLAAAAVAAVTARASLRRVGAIVGIAVVGLRRRDRLPRRRRRSRSSTSPGIGHKQKQTGVETYVQRTMLVYYGWRVFVDHPVAGRRLAGLERRVRLRAAPAAPARALPVHARDRLPVAGAPLRRSRTPTSRCSPTSASPAACCSSPRC